MNTLTNQNFFTDNPDIIFHLNKPYFNKIFNLLNKHNKDYSQEVSEYKKEIIEFLQNLGELSGQKITHYTKVLDFDSDNKELIKSTIQEILNQLKNLGTHKLCIPKQHQGLGYPIFVELIALEIIARACPSITLNMSSYNLIFHLIQDCPNFENKENLLNQISAGVCNGNIAFTEKSSGSDLRTISTYVKFDNKSKVWTIYGEKFFISNPDADFSIVLAKTTNPSTAEIKDLNLFLVPKEYNNKTNFIITKYLDTIGFRGSTFGCIKFDGSVAYPLAIGNNALTKIITFMNYGKLAVGFQALGIMEHCYRQANEFCTQRIAWDRSLNQHELILETLTDMKAQIQAFRSLCYETAYIYSYIHVYRHYLHNTHNKKLLPSYNTEIIKLEKRLKKLIPLIKWWASEKTFLITQKSLNILGGRGYLKESSLGRFLQDSLALGIYEGPVYNQALIVMKDTIKDFIRLPSKAIGITIRKSKLNICNNKDLNNKFNKCRTIFYKTLLKLMIQLIKENVQIKISSIDPSDISKALRIITKEIVDFKTISSAIFQSIRLCEMKTLIAIAYCNVSDTKLNPSRIPLTEYFLDHVLLKSEVLSKEILHPKKYLNETLKDMQSEQADSLSYLQGF